MTTVGAGLYEIRIHTELEHRVPQTREADMALARTRLADVLRLRGQKKKEAR